MHKDFAIMISIFMKVQVDINYAPQSGSSHEIDFYIIIFIILLFFL